MRAIIQDVNGRFIRSIKGSYENGSFVYKEGMGIPFLDKKNDEIPCNLSLIIDEGKEKLAVYKFDGKDYKQIPLGNAPKVDLTQSSLTDYKNNFKLGVLARDLTLPKPFGVADLVKYFTYFMIIVILCAVYFTVQNLNTTINNMNKPLNNTYNLLVAQQLQQRNDTLMLYHLFNATYNYLRGTR